jgi:transposase-like protein
MPKQPIDWDAIKIAYESGLAVSQIAKEFGITPQGLNKRARNGNWQKRSVSVAETLGTARSNVVDIVTRQTLENLGGKEGVEKLAASNAATIRESLEAAPAILKALTEWTVAIAEKGIKGELEFGTHQGEADALNATVTAYAKVQSVARTAQGLKDGLPSLGDSADDRQRRIVFKIHEPKTESVQETA